VTKLKSLGHGQVTQEKVLEYLDEIRTEMKHDIKQAPQPELIVIMQQLVRIEALLRWFVSRHC